MVVILDIETIAHPIAADFVPAPDLGSIQAAGNLKDPEKIAASIAERKAAAVSAHAVSIGRAALDWNLNRVVAIGTHLQEQDEPTVALCQTEAAEVKAIESLWRVTKASTFVGFNLRSFDLPVLIQRSRLLGIQTPKISLAPFGRSNDLIDVYDELTFHNNRGAGIMPQSLKVFARRFGLPVSDPTSGKDIAQLVTDGDWEGVRSHCLSDVDLTRELAVRIGLVKPWARVA